MTIEERLLMVRQLVLLIEPGCSAETLMANMEGLAEIMRAD